MNDNYTPPHTWTETKLLSTDGRYIYSEELVYKPVNLRGSPTLTREDTLGVVIPPASTTSTSSTTTGSTTTTTTRPTTTTTTTTTHTTTPENLPDGPEPSAWSVSWGYNNGNGDVPYSGLLTESQLFPSPYNGWVGRWSIAGENNWTITEIRDTADMFFDGAEHGENTVYELQIAWTTDGVRATKYSASKYSVVRSMDWSITMDGVNAVATQNAGQLIPAGTKFGIQWRYYGSDTWQTPVIGVVTSPITVVSLAVGEVIEARAAYFTASNVQLSDWPSDETQFTGRYVSAPSGTDWSVSSTTSGGIDGTILSAPEQITRVMFQSATNLPTAGRRWKDSTGEWQEIGGAQIIDSLPQTFRLTDSADPGTVYVHCAWIHESGIMLSDWSAPKSVSVTVTATTPDGSEFSVQWDPENTSVNVNVDTVPWGVTTWDIRSKKNSGAWVEYGESSDQPANIDDATVENDSYEVQVKWVSGFATSGLPTAWSSSVFFTATP